MPDIDVVLNRHDIQIQYERNKFAKKKLLQNSYKKSHSSNVERLVKWNLTTLVPFTSKNGKNESSRKENCIILKNTLKWNFLNTYFPCFVFIFLLLCIRLALDVCGLWFMLLVLWANIIYALRKQDESTGTVFSAFSAHSKQLYNAVYSHKSTRSQISSVSQFAWLR